jgi:uncharacterized protein (DUF58 family)
LNWLRRYFQAWVIKRNAAQKSHRLTHKNVFIFPTKLGGAYLLLVTLLWLLGTNYENNAILALSYLLLSVFLVSIFHCFLNIQGLVVHATKTVRVFVGEQAAIVLRFERTGLFKHQSVELAWQGMKKQPLSWENGLTQQVTIPYRAQKRGLLTSPVLSLRSLYPLGLIRCWCYLPMQSYVIVYPRAQAGEQIHTQVSSGASEEQSSSQAAQGGEQEFDHLGQYLAGEPLSLISWKHYARTGTLYKKNYSNNESESHELNWQHYPGVENEMRLSYLCYQALALSAQEKPFSLVLPSVSIARAQSDNHLLEVLEALALFEETLPAEFSKRGAQHG